MHVTGIITCHNYADHVGLAIESFLNQEYEPKRLIVIDDGSVDGSWDVIKNQTGDIEIFRFDSPMGPAFARNFAIEHGWDGADIFAFLDADDRYESEKLIKSVAVLSDPYGHPGIAYTDYRLIDEVRGISYDRYLSGFSLEALLNGRVVEGNYVVRKEVFRDVGRFDNKFKVAEGFDFLLRASEKFTIIHIPEILATVRITNRSLTHNVSESDWDSYRSIAINKKGRPLKQYEL